MTLKVTSLAAAGDLENERVIMRAFADLDLTNYALFCCRKSNIGFSGGRVPYVYWFWSTAVKKDDLVVVYTKAGTASKKDLGEGRTSHFFYWRLATPIWTPDVRAVSVYTPQWSLFENVPQSTG